jgi:hypothetical protein
MVALSVAAAEAMAVPWLLLLVVGCFRRRRRWSGG